MKSESEVKQAVPFYWVSNIETSVRFYVDGLGFEVTRRWLDRGTLRWCWLKRGGAALMLQEFAEDGHHASRPQSKLGEGVSLYLICDDATGIYREIASREITASRPVVENGMWVTELLDPDGYKLAFESETDAAEGSKFSE